MRGFVRRHLEPADRLGETLFGLVMALGFTGAVKWSRQDADERELFLGILGCNVAWGIVDGVMHALGEVFERGRKARLAHQVRHATSEAEAHAHVARALDDRLGPLTGDEDRAQVHRWVLERVRREAPPPATLTWADARGGAAVALIVVVATLPILVPFLLVDDASWSVRLSHGVAVLELALLGAWWARIVGASVWRISLGLSAVGLALAGVTVMLGG